VCSINPPDPPIVCTHRFGADSNVTATNLTVTGNRSGIGAGGIRTDNGGFPPGGILTVNGGIAYGGQSGTISGTPILNNTGNQRDPQVSGTGGIEVGGSGGRASPSRSRWPTAVATGRPSSAPARAPSDRHAPASSQGSCFRQGCQPVGPQGIS
jgi:hypothetical protein